MNYSIIRKLENLKYELKKENKIENTDIKRFTESTCGLLYDMFKLESKLKDEYFLVNTFVELKKENNNYFSCYLGENYDNSYANPDYSTKIFGNTLGKMFSFFYFRFEMIRYYSFEHNKDVLYAILLLFMDFYYYWLNHSRGTAKGLLENCKDTIYFLLALEEKEGFYSNIIRSNFYKNILMKSNLLDLRYLFKYGKYISEEEIALADFLNSYNPELLDKMAKKIVKDFLHGFISQNRDRKKRKSVEISYQVGQEQLVKRVVQEFLKINFRTYIYEVNSFENFLQCKYDHKFDEGLFKNKDYMKMKFTFFKNSIVYNEKMLKDICGRVKIIQFGKLPLSPKSKESTIKLNNFQQELIKAFQIKKMKIKNNYISPSNTSYCMVGFPNVAIGKNFKEIFDDFLKINLMESRKYETYQQIIINALDLADYIYLKGKDGNKTELFIKMKKIENPEKQTNFMNCGGDLNIPHGEVFTTPILSGTKGILHVKSIYLKGNKYINLKLKFQDGIIKSFSCGDFSNPSEGRKYILNTLFYPEKTLPMGEFAIGTNTLAYRIAKKYSIIDKLPILLVEKMGPHIAIGDPCYAWNEENVVYNILNNKEIIAKDNERTILKHKKPSEAYTNIHIDITIPYDEIALLQVIKPDREKLDIIKNGKYALKGVEELNKPFEYKERRTKSG